MPAVVGAHNFFVLPCCDPAEAGDACAEPNHDAGRLEQVPCCFPPSSFCVPVYTVGFCNAPTRLHLVRMY